MSDVRFVWRTSRYVSAIAAAVVCLCALAVSAESPSETIIIKGVPHIQQKPDFCGEACIAMHLQKLGHNVTQDDVFNITVAKSPAGFTDADYARHIMNLKPTMPMGFTIVLQRPFVVIGDEQAGLVRYRAEHTVKWFVDRIEKLYFKKDPPKIYDIWLFKDDKSYRKHAEEIFGDRPDTPFGYCSDARGALVMNIATGGGTLCHEIVHAYIASNFPGCPAWFNEGLASLYEQCGTRGDTVVGLTNWRLEGLKKEIQADNLPSFETLLSTTSYQFYNMAKGNNYAQARYLCYYLQEKGLLVNFYNAFVRNAKDDPSGCETLKKILNESDMGDFKKRWEKWVLNLTFG